MALICISASNRIRRNAYYTKKEKMLLEEFISEKKLSKIIIDASDLN